MSFCVLSVVVLNSVGFKLNGTPIDVDLTRQDDCFGPPGKARGRAGLAEEPHRGDEEEPVGDGRVHGRVGRGDF